MVKAENLFIQYGDKVAVDKLNIVIKQGEKVSIVGKSGCGKTSLLHAFSGLLKPSKGSVVIDGEMVNQLRKGTSIILQKDGLFPWKNVEANILLGVINEPLSNDEKQCLVKDLLIELDIVDVKDKFIHELSGGQRQRVAIARALIQFPDLLLMDEPSGSLDMITKEKFQDSLHHLYNRRDITSIIVTHDIEEAVYLGQRILVMEEGKIIYDCINPFYKKEKSRETIEFYELCLSIRQVMKS